MSSVRKQQTLVIGAVVLLLGFLLTRDVKGLVKPKEDVNKEMAAPAVDEHVLNLEQTSVVGKNLVSRDISSEITQLENEYKKAGEAEKLKAAEVLSKKWEAADQYIPAALYFEIVAKRESSLKNWLKAGKKFMNAFEGTQDAALQPALLQKANNAYKAALAIDTANLEAKTGLGTTIVNGLGAPMEGIAILVEVVKKDPRNTNALMQLGMFSMKSGQFDKAVGRFKEVIAVKPTSEAYFFLATAFENLNKNEEAVEAFLESKRIAANPTLSSFIDKKVAELKK